MNTIKETFEDYEKLIKIKIEIPLDNGDIIQFEFRKQDLPHLLGCSIWMIFKFSLNIKKTN